MLVLPLVPPVLIPFGLRSCPSWEKLLGIRVTSVVLYSNALPGTALKGIYGRIRRVAAIARCCTHLAHTLGVVKALHRAVFLVDSVRTAPHRIVGCMPS